MNVGKDIMGTMANTLILAYVGAGSPLLMTLYGYVRTKAQQAVFICSLCPILFPQSSYNIIIRKWTIYCIGELVVVIKVILFFFCFAKEKDTEAVWMFH